MKKLSVMLIIMAVLSSCGKDSESAPEPVAAPTTATLTKPTNNEVCTTGTVVTASESTITFAWNASEHTDSYLLSVKNLETGITTTTTSKTTSATITLKRNTPYSWFIVSSSASSSSTAKSEIWKFYNSGPGATSYAPFPAEIVSPSMGQTVTGSSGKLTLDWNGSDADGDITGYDIYLGTTTTVAIHKANEKESILSDIPITGNTTYYWKIVTRDSRGNTSDSGIYMFKVN